MTTLVLGATGATGRLLVQHLLDRDIPVKAIVRSADKLSAARQNHPQLTLIHASILDLDAATLAQHVAGCDAVASCLGHNLTLRGIWGQPRKLVTDATRRTCQAIKANKPSQPVKFVLMNTTGNQNRDLAEPISGAERVVLGLIRLLVPPQRDNEEASDVLRVEIGQDDSTIEWVVVRPDGLTNADTVTDYTLHPSPIRSAIFNAGQTSRINVGDFMARLIAEDDLWQQWRGQMPVIYNAE